MEEHLKDSGSGVQRSFKRIEKKYLLDASQFEMLWDSVKDRLLMDEYGTTTIMSIYYDDNDFSLIGRSADKPFYKEKFRLRSYGVPDDESTVFAEIKKKYDGIVYKRRVAGTYQQIIGLLEEGRTLDHDLQIQKEIMWVMKRYQLEPAAFIGYERTAYSSPADPGFRLTFDSDIRYRLTDLDLRKGSQGIPLREPGFRIMEVKTEGGVPLWFAKALSENRIYPGSFSKIGTCYKEVIIPGMYAGHDTDRRVKNV